jgi:hypothetical protein
MAVLAGIWEALRRLPREVWYVLAIGLALWIGHAWHERRIAEVIMTAKQEQAAADTAAFREAQDIAAEQQRKLVARTTARVEAINERTTDALEARNDDLARSYDDLRMRWAAHRAAESKSRGGAAAGVPGAAAGADAADCAAQGWVSFDVAAAAAEAADRAIAKDDAWIAWAKAQEAAWPRPDG